MTSSRFIWSNEFWNVRLLFNKSASGAKPQVSRRTGRVQHPAILLQRHSSEQQRRQMPSGPERGQEGERPRGPGVEHWLLRGCHQGGPLRTFWQTNFSVDWGVWTPVWASSSLGWFFVVVGILSIWLRSNIAVDSHIYPIPTLNLTLNMLPKVIIKLPTTTSFPTQNQPKEEVCHKRFAPIVSLR